MPRYISLLKFTEQGARAIKKSTARAHDFNAAAAKAGVKVEAQYWTVGRFDGVVILSGPSEQSVLRVLADLASLGNVRTQSLQAFSDQEFEAILGK
jgi:uncharacterized protein with GYD domain